MTLFRCTVPGVPIAQARMRHTKSGRGYYPAASKAHREALVMLFALEASKQRVRDIAEPCSVLIEIAGAHGGTDTDNHAKQVLDALVDAGVLAKDSLMVVRELTVRVVDGEPRTVVTIDAKEEV